MQVNDKSIPTRLSLLELQMDRYSSEIENDKRTMDRVNSDMFSRIETLRSEFREAQDKTNRILYMMVGGLTALQIVLQFSKH